MTTTTTCQRRLLSSHKKKSSEDERLQRTRSQSSSPSPNIREDFSPIQEENNGSRSLFPQLSHSSTLTTYHSHKNGEPDHGPLGLNVVYTPPNGHKADIIFIHGLGGTSRSTWSKYKNPELFWPLTFLRLEPDVCLARIFTFGYNADFRKAGNASTSVLDFAKDLLFDLKYAKDEQMEELKMGSVSELQVCYPNSI